ncbi:MAG: hypothetical protein KC636_14030 [Myxococcales bacterium]|nr:hypothetical protein [Myxococcales bacterium]
MSVSSSDELTPRSGARFVFLRGVDGAYEVTVHRASAVASDGQLALRVSWDDGGATVLEPAPDDPWVRAEVEKLARVVKRTGQARLTRWRG